MARDKGDTETNFEVRSYDTSLSPEEYRALPSMPIYVILDNLRSAFNVGSIFRICDTLRVRGLFLCGYTATPPHVKLDKTSLGTTDYVPWKKFTTAIDAIEWCRQQHVTVYASETTSVSQPFCNIEYPSPCAFVFGNEALGVSRDALERCHAMIEIPTYGFKNSLNVATACAVITHTAAHRIKPESFYPTAARS